MRKMKNSGIPWIGEIPEGWNIGKIGHNYSITLGKMIDSKEYASYEMSNYLCAANIKWNGVNIDVNKKMKFSNTEKALYLLQQGDVLIMEGGTAGTACVYNNEFSPCYIQNSVHRCRGLNGNITKYLYYWMNVVFYSGYINSICNRATILHYTKEKVARTPIIIPSINKQNQIVNFLDSKCSEIDTLIENLRARIESAKEYKKAVITEAVTKGLNKDAKMKDSGVEWIGEIPEGWKVVKLKQYIKNVSSGLSAVTSDASEDSGKYILRTSAVSSEKFIESEVKSVTKQAESRLICPVEADTVIMSRMNTSAMVGACAYVARNYENLFVPDKLWKIKFTLELSAKYAWYLINSAPIRGWFSSISTGASASMQNISLTDFHNAYAPIPRLIEQRQISDYLDSKCSEIDILLQNYEDQIATLEEYKKSLIYEYVTGKKEVPAA